MKEEMQQSERQDSNLSIADAIREAMDASKSSILSRPGTPRSTRERPPTPRSLAERPPTPRATERPPTPKSTVSRPGTPRSTVETPLDMRAPKPHLPLRKASAEKLQSRRPPPIPIFAHGQQLRGFNPSPSPAQATPQVDNINASSEHAFAPKEDKKKPFRPPLGAYAVKPGEEVPTPPTESADTSQPVVEDSAGGPPSSPLMTPPISPQKPKAKSLRKTRSVGEGLRKLGKRLSSPKRVRSKPSMEGELRSPVPETPPIYSPPLVNEGIRSSVPVNAPLRSPTFMNDEARSSAPIVAEIRTPVLVSEDFRSSVPVNTEKRVLHVVNGDERLSALVQPNETAAESDELLPPTVTSDRSAVTSSSSEKKTGSTQTEHSSLTRASSHTSDFVKVYPDWPATTPEVDTDDEMTVEDAIGMYVNGFEDSARPSIETEKRASRIDENPDAEIEATEEAQDIRRASQQSEQQPKTPRPLLAHRRSQSASLLLSVTKSNDGNLAPPRLTDRSHTFSRILSIPTPKAGDESNRTSMRTTADVPRDRYGFKKASLHIRTEQYDAWDADYSLHLERRRKKWDILMKQYGLSAEQPIRFPPKSDKIKRYVRKGIPPEFRGAAWFWYAGGPSKLKQNEGLYNKLCESVKEGKLNDSDREHIERDLNRTFPDNILFKPDPSSMTDAQAGAGGGDEDARSKKSSRISTEPETPIVRALRRVLQAFAVHNPHIGYCQSLNFIAGLLLLFLDEDEEKAFILLNIVTTVHLPATHTVALEGANIDIAVLMTCVRDSLPAIWAKIDDSGAIPLATSAPRAQALRLPTVSLATTAWFMSIFVGTLPIESVLRIWDCLFFEGSKTLFRIALAILKFGERQILAVNDSAEIFQVVQLIPKSMLDINALMEVCFRRRGGFGHISQGLIESRREERRQAVKDGVAGIKEERAASKWVGRWRAKTKV